MMAAMGRRAGWVALWLAAALLVAQAVSLVDRAGKGESDFGVFYRTARLLSEDVGGELYEGRDSVTGWPISIPPAGMALFQPFSYLSPGVAGAAWGAVNLVLCALGLLSLRRVFERSTQNEALLAAFPWLGAVFLVLAGGSVQVGQFSALFVACWVFALCWSLTPKPFAVQLTWAVPAAIKVYPLLMFAVPLSVGDSWRGFQRNAGLFVLSLLLLWFAVPLLFYGLRVWELNGSFFENVVLDPGGRLNWMQALGSNANQSLDATLIRYLSYYPKFHDRYEWMPTVQWDLDTVRTLGHFVRLVFLAVTVWAVVRWRRGRASFGVDDLLTMAAVWSATLWVCMPETRARYAVYAFLGFVPLALWAVRSASGRQRFLRVAAFVLVFLFVLGFLPPTLEVVGVGFVGTFALWLFNVLSLWRS